MSTTDTEAAAPAQRRGKSTPVEPHGGGDFFVRLCAHMEAQALGTITVRQLATLAFARANPGCSVKPIAEALSISKPAVTRALDALGDAGLARRVNPAKGGDQRQTSVHINQLGLDLLAGLDRLVGEPAA